ncbi:phosphatase PAP2 family protein [Marmoricola sp. URHB0036]|uniref:phosphatase PAP2 family protein n=1 Tax=Marmoricola sp. URHB0036 TaxID=1298863 RepID=UPI0004003DFD|nr:phosphatase PAP2 family protein [Marmoricola sp. URHB0036]
MSRLDVSSTDDAPRRWQLSDAGGARLVLVLIACLATTGVVALADAAREHDGVSRLDPTAAADIVRMRTPTLTELAHVFTFLGSEVVVGGLALVVLATLLMRHQPSRAATFAIGMAGSAFLTVVVKLVVARPRPGEVDRLGALDTSYSFPSGHTLNSTVFIALVVWLLWPSVTRAGRIALVTGGAVLAVGVASSRIYLGYHWLTDVLASGLVALAWLCVVGLLGSTLTRAGRLTQSV